MLDFLLKYYPLLAISVATIAALVEARAKIHHMQKRIDRTDEEVKELRDTIRSDIKEVLKKIDDNHRDIVGHLLNSRGQE